MSDINPTCLVPPVCSHRLYVPKASFIRAHSTRRGMDIVGATLPVAIVAFHSFLVTTGLDAKTTYNAGGSYLGQVKVGF